MPRSKVNHIDCFSGPGGICTGFAAAGINTVAAVEKVESCVQTYSANHPTVNVIHKDIREVDEDDIRRAVGRKHIHLVTSGMPCETFSTAGSSSRSHYDYRQQLYSEAIRIAVIVNADLILFENVPAILTKKVEKDSDRLVIQDILSELRDNGYLYTAQYVLKAVEFGVPQTRERFFLLASRRADLLLRAPVAPEGQRPVTVRDAFAGLPIMHANANDLNYDYTGEESDYTRLLKNSAFWRIQDNPELTFFNSPTHRKGTLKRFELIAPNQSLIDIFKSRSDEELAKLKKERVISDKWYIQRNKRLQWDAPSKTVTSHCLDELLHPELNRALSVRECARLQSFPDSYVFRGPYIIPHKSPIQDMYEQIGDAVPPLLAYHWGRTIRRILGR